MFNIYYICYLQDNCSGLQKKTGSFFSNLCPYFGTLGYRGNEENKHPHMFLFFHGLCSLVQVVLQGELQPPPLISCNLGRLSLLPHIVGLLDSLLI